MTPDDMIQGFFISLIAGLITGIITSILATLIAVNVIEYNRYLSTMLNEIEYNRQMFEKFPENLEHVKKEWLDKKTKWLPKVESPGSSHYLFHYLPSFEFNNFKNRGFSQNIEKARFGRLALFYNICKNFSDKTQFIEDEIDILDRNDINYENKIEDLCQQMNNLYEANKSEFFDHYSNFNPIDRKGLKYHFWKDLRNLFF